MKFVCIKLILLLTLSMCCTACYAGGATFISYFEKIFFPLKEHTLTLLFSSGLIIILGIIYRIKVSTIEQQIIPDPFVSLRNILDSLGEFVYEQARSILGREDAKRFFPFLAMIFIFVLFNNLLGLVPGFLPPTENLNTTFALGVISFIYYNIAGIRKHGFFKYMKHFWGPIWYMGIIIFPIEIISNCVRPVSLALRLRGNIFGDHLVLGVFSSLVPYIIPAIFMFFGLLISVIQAYVFFVLTTVYIAVAVSEEHSDEAHH